MFDDGQHVLTSNHGDHLGGAAEGRDERLQQAGQLLQTHGGARRYVSRVGQRLTGPGHSVPDLELTIQQLQLSSIIRTGGLKQCSKHFSFLLLPLH